MKTLKDFQELVDNGLCIYLEQDVDSSMLDSLRRQLASIRDRRDRQLKDGIEPTFKPGAKIAIMLTTSGGSSKVGRSIINQIKALDSLYEVWIVCHTHIASMGTFIMMAVPKDRRVAFADTDFYCHRARISTSNAFTGSSKDFQYELKESEATQKRLEREMKNLQKLLSAGTGLGLNQIKSLENSPEFFGTTLAKKRGFISHVLN